MVQQDIAQVFERGGFTRCEWAPAVSDNDIKTIVKRVVEDAAKPLRTTPSHSERGLYQQLRGELERVNIYEDPSAQEQALNAIPLQQLYDKVAEAMTVDTEADEQTLLVKQLLAWFKNDFFTWVDKLPCAFCSSKSTDFLGSGTPTPDELRHGGARIELYRCQTCGSTSRFPRFNDPVKLLETRRGRCGEYANCFTLCCRAVGLQARYVRDWTDHVWTEVYIDRLARWVHTDCCENAFDAPLMYEVGWGKQLSYIFAFAKDEVVDVAQRYTRNIQQLAPRRREAREEWLAKALVNLRNVALRKRVDGDTDRHNVLVRQYRERLELEATSRQRNLTAAETAGRQSGTSAPLWRSERGEMGSIENHRPFAPLASAQAVYKFNGGNHSHLRQVGSSHLADSATCSTTHPSRVIALTEHKTDQRGACWLAESQLSTSKDFQAEFKLRIGAQGRGADGMALVLQSAGLDVLGEGGSGLGYTGIPKSVAVEFDTYMSYMSHHDPDDNHVSIHTRYALPNSAHHDHALACTSSVPVLNSGDVHQFCVQYRADTHELSVWMREENADGTLTAPIWVRLVDATVDMTRLGAGVWVGFTAATGGIAQSHQVLDFEVMGSAE
ncbi:Peptide-N(4)-(N-acetyl-beta- glucosaminyl)asparagine amidase [Sorochytrium milnesiophthora]